MTFVQDKVGDAEGAGPWAGAKRAAMKSGHKMPDRA
jgi:hypothetical protein